jgi:hypothetical protein
MHKYRMVHPNGPAKRNFDVFIGLLIIFSVFWVPVQVGFDVTSTDAMVTVYYVVDSFFFIDMCVSFRTVYFSAEDDAFVAVPGRVLSHYMRHWFLIDFCSFFPFSEIITAATQHDADNSVASIGLVKLARLLRLLKLARLFKSTEYRSAIEQRLLLSPTVLDLVETVLSVMFISHLVACFWWGMCRIQTYAWSVSLSMNLH